MILYNDKNCSNQLLFIILIIADLHAILTLYNTLIPGYCPNKPNNYLKIHTCIKWKTDI
jgi:hypothetical protein